jgi:hypothetical protein
MTTKWSQTPSGAAIPPTIETHARARCEASVVTANVEALNMAGRRSMVVWSCVAMLVGASFVAAALQSSSVDVARAECVARGWSADEIEHVGWDWSSKFGFDQTNREDFLVKKSNPLERLRVTVRRSAYFLPWSVTEFEKIAEADLRAER